MKSSSQYHLIHSMYPCFSIPIHHPSSLPFIIRDHPSHLLFRHPCCHCLLPACLLCTSQWRRHTHAASLSLYVDLSANQEKEREEVCSRSLLWWILAEKGNDKRRASACTPISSLISSLLISLSLHLITFSYMHLCQKEKGRLITLLFSRLVHSSFWN